jgi:hypothetical protein
MIELGTAQKGILSNSWTSWSFLDKHNTSEERDEQPIGTN